MKQVKSEASSSPKLFQNLFCEGFSSFYYIVTNTTKWSLLIHLWHTFTHWITAGDGGCSVKTLKRAHRNQLDVMPTSWLSAGVCQGLAASQTADTDRGMLQILTIVWGEAEECRLPGYVHCHQWTQPEASSHEGRPGPTDPTVKPRSPLPSVISYPSPLDSVGLVQLGCPNTEYLVEELLILCHKNCQRLDTKWPHQIRVSWFFCCKQMLSINQWILRSR